MTSDGTYVLWGSPHSYYTGKIRSYLIKKGVPYREEFAFHPRFQGHILPAVRHFVVPILETPDGRILQDTTDMIEHIEAAMPLLALGRLETWPKLGHGLLPVREAVLDRVAAFLTELATASVGPVTIVLTNQEDGSRTHVGGSIDTRLVETRRMFRCDR